jgi:L-cysteine desulfidase
MDQTTAARILAGNMTKTMGCTDIGVVGYIASIGAYVLRNRTIQTVELVMSEELYKNSVNVGVPGLRKSGLDKALALGILLKNPKQQLSVFESVTNDDIEQIDALLNRIEVSITHRKFPDTVLYEELRMTSQEGDDVRIVIRDFYDNVVLVTRNGEQLRDFEKDALLDRVHKYRIESYDEILDYVAEGDFTGLDELFRIAADQYASARKEIKTEGGNYLVEDLPLSQRQCLYDLSNILRKHITVPSRKRMQGDVYTVYGVAGSGNLGIGTLVTPMFLADAFEVDDHRRRQLVVLSFFTSVYVKQAMSVVTVLCGTGHATGCSTAATTAFVKGGRTSHIKEAINMYLASSMGVVCDGAKVSCTYKVSFAAMNGMIAAKTVMDHPDTCDGIGLNKTDVDATIRNLGVLNNDILHHANKGIIELI